MEIHVLHRQGKSIREIARDTGASRNTIRSVLRGKADEQYGPRQSMPSILDPYKEYLRSRLERAGAIRIDATVLQREIAPARLPRKHLPHTPVRDDNSSAPGAGTGRSVRDATGQANADRLRRRSARRISAACFTAELGYSRYPYAEFTDNERAETLVACLERALQWFGGVPRHILCDNPKTIVIKRNAYDDGQHRFNDKLYDLAKHYGFQIHLCAPYRAQTKGKVERFHRYLRSSFIDPLQSRQADPIDVALCNREVVPWLREVAGARVHATLNERPIDRFQLEREHLLALAPPYGGHRRVHLAPSSPMPVPFESLQHPLATYERLAREIAR